MVTDSVSGTRRRREHILGIQIVSQLFYAAGSIILKGYSSTAQNAVAVIRNIAGIKNIKNKAVEWSLIALGVILGAVFNNRGLLGWLPIVANFIYSVAIFRFKDNEKGLKTVFIINLLMYSAFSLVIRNYVGVVSNTFVAIITFISLVRGRKKKAE